jgi:lysozyme
MTLADDLRRDEGERLKPYFDTANKVTIGVGRNLTDVGITAAESAAMLDNDITRVEAECSAKMPWLAGCPEPVQRGVKNMLFIVGWPRLSGFKNMLAALRAGDWDTAAQEALDSAWAKQVGARATRIAALFRGPH